MKKDTKKALELANTALPGLVPATGASLAITAVSVALENNQTTRNMVSMSMAATVGCALYENLPADLGFFRYIIAGTIGYAGYKATDAVLKELPNAK